MNPLVSIIIPTYLRSHLLIKPLESIINQSYVNWECIIIDDGSDDLTIETIMDFINNEPRLKLYKRPYNSEKGPSACRNEGIKKAKGKYLQFFDDDDVMYPNLLMEKVNLMEKKGFDVLVSPLDFFSVEENKVTHTNNIVSKNIIQSYILGDISWYVSGPLWLKSFITEYFDERVQTLDDWDFNLRNIYNNPKVGFLNQSFQQYNMYGIGNTLGTRAQLGDEKQLKSVYYVYKKHFLILKELKILDTKLYLRFYKLLVPILRSSLIHKYDISKSIFRFLMLHIKKGVFPKFIKVFVGYFTYRFFNKGYNLVKF